MTIELNSNNYLWYRYILNVKSYDTYLKCNGKYEFILVTNDVFSFYCGHAKKITCVKNIFVPKNYYVIFAFKKLIEAINFKFSQVERKFKTGIFKNEDILNKCDQTLDNYTRKYYDEDFTTYKEKQEAKMIDIKVSNDPELDFRKYQANCFYVWFEKYTDEYDAKNIYVSYDNIVKVIDNKCDFDKSNKILCFDFENFFNNNYHKWKTCPPKDTHEFFEYKENIKKNKIRLINKYL